MDIMARLESANDSQTPVIVDNQHKEQLQSEQAAEMEGQDPLASNALYKQYPVEERSPKIRPKRRTIQVAITTVIEEEDSNEARESNEATPQSCKNKRYKGKGSGEQDPYATVNDVFDMVAKR